MKLRITRSFSQKLNKQIEYIAKDKPQAAKKLKSEILKEIKDASEMPFGCRKSIFFERKDIRDLIIKGYVVVFKVDKERDLMEIFGFTKWEDDPF
jgi:plasmid stabilization system protein ParE